MVNSMDVPWIFDNRPWFCYIYYEKSMEQPWVVRVFPMVNRWDFLLVFFSMAIERHGYSMDLTMGFPGITMDFQ